MGHQHWMRLKTCNKAYWRKGVIFALWVTGCCITTAAWGQEGTAATEGRAAAVENLPSAPVAQVPTATAQAAEGQATGIIFGTVQDGDGALVQGADVTLLNDTTKQERTAVSDSGGKFNIPGVVAGEFRLTIRAKGLATGKIIGTLTPGEIYNAPPIRLRVASTATEVYVTPETEYVIAQEQVKVAEKQRVLGIVPNYFVTYDKNPVPLHAKQKFSLGLHAAFDPTHFVFSAGIAGFEQMTSMYTGFGAGPEGFGKRYGAALATTTTSELLRGSVYPSLFRQDPRYFYKGTGSTWSRTKYALSTALIAKGDKGRWEANYSAILAGLTAGAISNLYYAPSDRQGVTLTIESGLVSIAGVAFGHVMQEFVFRSYTSHVPAAGTP